MIKLDADESMLVLITKGYEAKMLKATKPGSLNYIQEVLNKRSNVPDGVNVNIHAIYLNLAALLISEEVLKYKDPEETISYIASLQVNNKMELDYSEVLRPS